jgi:Arc/MetJ-type ribon-helix-helix transcriptional regulator
MSEQVMVELPDDVAQELGALNDRRVNEVVSNALREALDLVEDAEEKRESLRESMGLSGRDSEELSDDSLTAAERKQVELRQKIREGR